MVMRISGLASGMDIDEIVTNLMKAERMPLDKIQQKKIYPEWQRDDYRTINTALSELDTLIRDGIGRQASFIKKTVTTSNDAAISVKNVNSTSDFSGEIKVTTLASAARMVSTANDISATTKLDGTASASGVPSFVGQTIKIKAINKEGSFDQVDKLDGYGNIVVKDGDGNEIPIFTGADGKPVLSGDGKYFEADPDTGAQLTALIDPTTVTIAKEDKWFEYEITATDTLQSVIDKINAESGVTAFFDEKTKKFSITAKNTGDVAAQAEIYLEVVKKVEKIKDGTIEDITVKVEEEIAAPAKSFFTDIMNMEGNSDAGTGSKGVNAKFDYNGLIDLERPSNTFTINGAEITLKQQTTDSVTFSSKPDVDTIYDGIKKFVDSYNGLIATISEKISEKKTAGYQPLTDSEKEALSEKEVEKWEKLARKGTLRNDSTLSSLLTKMRTSIYTAVGGSSLNNLAKIGIATTNDYTAGGKLEIKEDVLRKAIAEDPNGIFNLFMANGEKTVPDTVNGGTKTEIDFGQHGVARRLRADLQSVMKAIGEKAGKTASAVNNTFTLGKLLDDYNNKISAFEKRLQSLETRYYKQFSAMETAINKANSQSASLASYFQ